MNHALTNYQLSNAWKTEVNAFDKSMAIIRLVDGAALVMTEMPLAIAEHLVEIHNASIRGIRRLPPPEIKPEPVRVPAPPPDQLASVIAGLKKRERQVYDVIKKSIDTTGIAPTIREIGEKLGLSSSSTAQVYVKGLEEKGLLHRKPRPGDAPVMGYTLVGTGVTCPNCSTIVPLPGGDV